MVVLLVCRLGITQVIKPLVDMAGSVHKPPIASPVVSLVGAQVGLVFPTY